MNATGWSVFRGDLRRSVEAIGQAPMLVVLTFGLHVALYISRPIVFIAAALFLVEAGFVGTQRVWFARIYRGDHVSGREIVPLTGSFIGRFVFLGLLMSIAASPFVLLAHPPHERLQVGWAIVVVAVLLVVDIALTFVVPALALTTRSVSDALRIGLLMIKATWPTSAWYLVTPGLTLVLLSNAVQLSSYSPNVALRIVLIASTAVLAVWFKGAIVAFYLRQPPAPPRRSTG